MRGDLQAWRRQAEVVEAWLSRGITCGPFLGCPSASVVSFRAVGQSCTGSPGEIAVAG